MRGFVLICMGLALGLGPSWARADAAAALASSPAAARPAVPVGGPSAALVGRVMDRPGGKPIVGAKVRVYSEWTRTSVELQTDRDGAYGFVPHVPGPYRLMVVGRPDGVWAWRESGAYRPTD